MFSLIRGFVLIGCLFLAGTAPAQDHTAVFYQSDFPAADSAGVALDALKSGFPSAQFVTAAELPAILADEKTDLLVMPYGSTYPEAAWPAILRYLTAAATL